MDDLRVGRILRALRRRLGLRQRDLAKSARVSQQLVSLIERGHLDRLAVATLRRVFATVDARFESSVTWRGGALDRLVDAAHADLVEHIARVLRSHGWTVHIEVTFNEYGDRGSIDVMGLRPDLGIALIVEVKTEITAADDTARRLDVKVRLASKIVADRFDWRPTSVARLLVVLDTSTNRRRLDALEASLGSTVPQRGATVRRWLREPQGALAGRLFLSGTNRRSARAGRPRCEGPGRWVSPSPYRPGW